MTEDVIKTSPFIVCTPAESVSWKSTPTSGQESLIIRLVASEQRALPSVRQRHSEHYTTATSGGARRFRSD